MAAKDRALLKVALKAAEEGGLLGGAESPALKAALELYGVLEEERKAAKAAKKAAAAAEGGGEEATAAAAAATDAAAGGGNEGEGGVDVEKAKRKAVRALKRAIGEAEGEGAGVEALEALAEVLERFKTLEISDVEGFAEDYRAGKDAYKALKKTLKAAAAAAEGGSA